MEKNKQKVYLIIDDRFSKTKVSDCYRSKEDAENEICKRIKAMGDYKEIHCRVIEREII